MAPISLLDLPVELRIHIYHYAFRDSVVVVCACQRLPASIHTGLLFTCKLCYAEARSVFWQESRVAGCNSHDGCSLKVLVDGTGLSEFAKAHIKHIGDGGFDLDRRMVRKVLREFPGLETCRIASPTEAGTKRTGRDKDALEYDGEICKCVVYECLKLEPHAYIRRKYGIYPTTSKVTFFTCIGVLTIPFMPTEFAKFYIAVRKITGFAWIIVTDIERRNAGSTSKPTQYLFGGHGRETKGAG
ncbi:hypothetical protein F4818DRAFT_451483 [Hypoxylon cercidicola]|nr:hypothetical protein F4818DRAFT_451483 [Hypoxylon cercidicola]